MERRTVGSRSNNWIRKAAAWLSRTAVTPNQISASSVAAAALVPLGLFVVGGAPGVVLALAGVQLRLLANVIDGLVAVEGGKGGPLGALYNELPDRLSDSIILVSLGCSVGLPALGWAAALAAALTAYVRVFGGAIGLPQSFSGPMAKQHRMAVVNLALLLMFFHSALSLTLQQMALWVIALGSAWTCVQRTRGIAKAVEQGVPR